MGHHVLQPADLAWIARPHEPGERPGHTAELSERAGLAHARANFWRYEPGAKGRRHRHPLQAETFVPIDGTLTLYLGEPPQRCDEPPGGMIQVNAGTPLQPPNHGDRDLLVYVHGWPPESERAELLEPAV